MASFPHLRRSRPSPPHPSRGTFLALGSVVIGAWALARIQTGRPLEPPRAITDVLPHFAQLAFHYICDGNTDCANHLYIPPLNDQVRIVKNMHEAAMKTDIEGFQGVFMRLFSDRAFDTAGQLVAAIDQLHHVKDAIETIAVSTDSWAAVDPLTEGGLEARRSR
jgi:hypothetical protein